MIFPIEWMISKKERKDDIQAAYNSMKIIIWQSGVETWGIWQIGMQADRQVAR